MDGAGRQTMIVKGGFMKPKEICQQAWLEIGSKFPDFKIAKNGQTLKKVSKNKDLTFLISFQANRRNYACSVEFSVHFLIESKAMKKDNINNGFVYGGELETLINRGRGFRWFELAGASYSYSVDEVIKLLKQYMIPLCDDFEDIEQSIDKILEKNNMGLDLFYYVHYFGGKDKAERYLQDFIRESKLKNKYIGFYKSLEKVPREHIDIYFSEFTGANTLKFAYLQGIEI